MSRDDEGKEPVSFEDWYVMATTDLAVLVKPSADADDSHKVWLPKSQMDVLSGELLRGHSIDFEIPQWLAEKSELT